MKWRDLLARIGVDVPGLPALARDASTSAGLVNRRAFLGLAGAVVASLAIDPELLLWTPSERTILLPAMASPFSVPMTWITPEWVTRETARHWANDIRFATLCDRRYA